MDRVGGSDRLPVADGRRVYHIIHYFITSMCCTCMINMYGVELIILYRVAFFFVLLFLLSSMSEYLTRFYFHVFIVIVHLMSICRPFLKLYTLNKTGTTGFHTGQHIEFFSRLILQGKTKAQNDLYSIIRC